MALGFNKTDVNIEALPVVSEFLNNEKGGVEVVEIIEYNGKQAVNARDLHQKLGVGKDFSSWIKNRIEKYGFVENQDYSSFTQIGERTKGATVRKEYALSLDMAKELCMVENNERGRMIRKYFIEVEKKAREQGNFTIPQSYSEALLLAANQAKQIEMQQLALEQKQVENDKLVADGKRKDATIVRMKPKEVFTDAVAGSKGNCLIGECAKLITQNGYKIGEKQFFAWLRENGYLGKKGERYNIPNQQYVGKNALFYIKKGVRTGNSGVLHTTSTTMLTPKGQIYFVNKFLGKGGLQGDLFADGETHK